MSVRRCLPLVFVLASSYALGRLVINVLFTRSLGLNPEFCAHVAGVTVVQLGAVALIDWLRCGRGRNSATPAGAGSGAP